jgi:hypothetical protein
MLEPRLFICIRFPNGNVMTSLMPLHGPAERLQVLLDGFLYVGHLIYAYSLHFR